MALQTCTGAGTNSRIVGISEMKISQNQTDILVTYSLGSCVGMSVYDPVAKVGGLIHCMLPLSKIDPVKAKNNPFMFTDTGVPLMLETLFNAGAQKNRLIVKVAGASTLLDEKRLFRIGERNHTVLRKILWKNGILIAAEDVGGTASRTMYLYMASGMTTIKSGGREVEL
jgi:chemotaxis protein CheD